MAWVRGGSGGCLDIIGSRDLGVCILAGHTGVIPHLAFSPDGRQVATAGADRGTFHSPQLDRISVLAYSPDGATLAHLSRDQTFSFRNLRTSTPTYVFGEARKIFEAVYGGSFGDPLMGKLRLWDLGRTKEIAVLKTMTQVFDVTFAPDGLRQVGGGRIHPLRQAPNALP